VAVRGMSACKTYRRHDCTRRHRTYATLARCIWGRRAAWVMGEGPFATLAWCRTLTVSLHRTLEAATEAKGYIDSTSCGGVCTGRHEIIRLEPGGRAIENPGTQLQNRSQRSSGKHSPRGPMGG